MDQIDIKKLRYAYGMTQLDLAKALNCTQGFVSKLERGERDLSLEQRFILRQLLNSKKKSRPVLRRRIDT